MFNAIKWRIVLANKDYLTLVKLFKWEICNKKVEKNSVLNIFTTFDIFMRNLVGGKKRF